MGPDETFDFTTFSEAFDRVYRSATEPNPEGRTQTDAIMQHTDLDGEFNWDTTIATSPYLSYSPMPGRIETDGARVRIQGLDVVNAIAQLPNEEKRKVLELLLEAFDEAPEEKSVTVKKANRLRELLIHSKKSTS